MEKPTRTKRFESADDYLELSYQELEKRNLQLREEVESGKNAEEIKKSIIEALKEEEAVKAVTVYFSDSEGKLHAFEYDKKYFLESIDNLTFDGSSIKGFTAQHMSDLRLKPDFTSFYWAPADVFGKGKVIMFGDANTPDGEIYAGDHRATLKTFGKELAGEHGLTVNVAPEVEGFLVKGRHAEQNFKEEQGFEMASQGGYADAYPQDDLHVFIDWQAEATRALGMKNEKDHPEVASGQFELNYRFADMVRSADQVQLLKLVARQIADKLGFTATFLPKPSENVNGSGMHMNISLSKEGKNLFYNADHSTKLSEMARKFVAGILKEGKGICLALNSSVNAYRRLDPAKEAPNEIKVSDRDRGSMIRIPVGNEKSTRIEVRTVAPDANPYLATMIMVRAGVDGALGDTVQLEDFDKFFNMDPKKVEKLPGSLQEAINAFKKSDFVRKTMDEDSFEKYVSLKQSTADRSPKALGNKIKKWEVIDHHTVTNQELRSQF